MRHWTAGCHVVGWTAGLFQSLVAMRSASLKDRTNLLLVACVICACVSVHDAGKAAPKGKQKLPDDCKGKRCTAKPQSGYQGYCKRCFRIKFPKEYAEKQQQRLKKCIYCGETKELHRSGLCKPCARARSCEGCSEVNVPWR